MNIIKENENISEKMNKIKDRISNKKEIEIESTEVDKTFNKLKSLQDLLKKESALKELCKKKKFNIYKFFN
jgi:DNA replicative helicase MCM subunit Mcm2 (Cdc46/Mcm family)